LINQLKAAVKAATRHRLVEAARDLFWEQGYTATGIAQVLKTAKVQSGSLYYFFPTKEDLLLSVLDWYKANLIPVVVKPVFDRIHDPIERIFGILDGYRRMLMLRKFEQGCPVGNLALELSNSHATARGPLAECFTAWCKVIEGCLADAAGRLPASLDRGQLALFVLTTMEGAIMLARTYRSIGPYDTAITQLRDYFDRLIDDGTNWQNGPRPKRKLKRPRRGK
jgi:AcrR family transcriptional regulator